MLPTSGRSAAVDEGEAANPALFLPLPPASKQQSGRGADAAREEEAGSKRPGCVDRQIPAELAADVGRVLHLGAQRVDRLRQALALGLELTAHLFGASAVTRCHCSSELASSAWPRRSPAPEQAATHAAPF